MTKTNHADPFEAEAQPDLFGTPAPKAYVPDPQHVRNRLKALIEQMEASASWPWPEAMVELHRGKTFEYLCGLLPADEAGSWRARITAQVERLDAPAQAAE